MRKAGLVILYFLSGSAGVCAGAEDRSLSQQLSFEAQQDPGFPRGWFGGPPNTIFADNQVVHGGNWSARIDRLADSPQAFSTLTCSIPLNFAGHQIEFRGFLRTEAVSEFAGLWLREDADSGVVAFDSMPSRHLHGTTAWTEYSITLPLEGKANKLFFGVLLGGSGRTWADDLVLLVDGKPIADAPRIEQLLTVMDKDHEFDTGSRITLQQLTPTQIGNLAMLAKVWGFLKYHHARITAGERHWDYDLLRILPVILAAGDRRTATAALVKWIGALGNVPPCVSCVQLPQTELQMRPDIRWISDTALLGKPLADRLQDTYRDRTGKQFYVSLVENIGNPSFDHELPYGSLRWPDAGFQILGLFRYWNAIEYWYPNRDILQENWDEVLREFLPKISLAQDAKQYQLALMTLIARVHDSHANLWSSLALRPPAGACEVPVKVRVIEGAFVVDQSPINPTAAFEPGDVITKLDAVPLTKLIRDWKPYYGESNGSALLRDIALAMTHGACGPLKIWVRRGSKEIMVKAERIPAQQPYKYLTHDLPGPAFRLLSPDVAYLKLSEVKSAEAAQYVTEAAHTKGWIIDIRNYPAEFVVFALGSHLVGKESPFVRFTIGDLANPGAFDWTKPLQLPPQDPRYQGKIVLLVDERSQSQSEYTAMAFRAAPGAVIVGSTTAGADGNVSTIPLPGGFSTMISGIGVFYPDKRPTQRIGIVADVPAPPTIAGVRAGRDEVLEAGLRQIIGAEKAAALMETLSRGNVDNARQLK
jgi:C-terminal processing protease CtpA/Prc